LVDRSIRIFRSLRDGFGAGQVVHDATTARGSSSNRVKIYSKPPPKQGLDQSKFGSKLKVRLRAAIPEGNQSPK
jgi:hypothetical protein